MKTKQTDESYFETAINIATLAAFIAFVLLAGGVL